jgi:hypothetical protein
MLLNARPQTIRLGQRDNRKFVSLRVFVRGQLSVLLSPRWVGRAEVVEAIYISKRNVDVEPAKVLVAGVGDIHGIAK